MKKKNKKNKIIIIIKYICAHSGKESQEILRKTSSLPVRSDRTAKEFGELKLISGDPDPILELLKFGVWHLKQIQT